MFRMRSLSKKLEVTLGPDTGDLSMRMGIHSGPVTAGVLRGERSRFQLFGDTMNTAARMEHTGERDRIQLSQETADLLIAAGKTNWLSQREDRTLFGCCCHVDSVSLKEGCFPRVILFSSNQTPFFPSLRSRNPKRQG
jgi:class 3 adenylate cyclase